VVTTTANVTDRTSALTMAEQYKDSLASVVNFLVDGGYSGEKFATDIKELLAAAVQAAKRNELHMFEVIPQRWIVERSWAWLEKCRRLWNRFLDLKNCAVASTTIHNK
jgi:transposase